MKKPSSPKAPRRTKRVPSRARPPAVNPLLALVVKALDDKKAGDIRVLNVAALSSITDFIIIATATSDPHQRALRVELEKVFDGQKARILGIETARESGWTVVDAFDVMVHVFTAENREKYGLENLWKDAAEVPTGALLAEKSEP